MAATPSMMIELGTPCPPFALSDPAGRVWTNEDFADEPVLVVMVICNHCPFVKLIRDELAAIGRDYMPHGVGFIAVNANDIERYPDDAPDKMALEADAAGYAFPYVYDADQSFVRELGAACTPDFFVFDASRALVYRGQLDDARPGSTIPVTGSDLRAALDALLAGEPVSANQQPSIGCNIKWKPGNEPDQPI